MKKLIVILVIALVPYFAVAQSAFDKYENMKDVSSVVITSKMFKLLSKIDVEADDAEVQEFMDMVEKIKNIKVFATSNLEVGKKMKMDVDKYLSGSSLDELMRVNSDGKNVRFYYKPGKDEDHVSELFMFIDGVKESGDGPNTVVLTLVGDIDLKQISKLTEKMNIPGGEELKKVEKKN